MNTQISPYLEIENTLILREDAETLSDGIDQAISELFESKGSVEDILKDLFTPAQNRAVLALFAAQVVDTKELSEV